MGDVAGGFDVNRAPELPYYRCEVLAVGVVYGQDHEVPYVLATFQTIIPYWRFGGCAARHCASRTGSTPT